jgi:hypothetical protein
MVPNGSRWFPLVDPTQSDAGEAPGANRERIMTGPTPRSYDGSPVLLGRALGDHLPLYEPITEAESALVATIQDALYADDWGGDDIEHVLSSVLLVRRVRRL